MEVGEDLVDRVQVEVVVELDLSLAVGVVEVPAHDSGEEVLLNETKFSQEEVEPELDWIPQAVWLPPQSHRVVEQSRE